MSSYSSLSPDSFAGGSAGISSSASASASTYSNVSFRSNSVPDSSSGNIPVVQNSCQLYMGDLNPEWSENDIKSIWSMLGEPNVQVKLIKSSNPNKSHSAQNSGYCFVEFANQVAARNALMKSGLQVPLDPNYVLKLNWASFATAPGTEFTIFVGDLAPNVTEAQLFELFISRYSSTLNAKIVFDQFTGVSKGYGFVKFVNEAEQQRALVDMQGVFLNGRAIRVGATSKNKYQQQQQQQQHHHHQNQHQHQHQHPHSHQQQHQQQHRFGSNGSASVAPPTSASASAQQVSSSVSSVNSGMAQSKFSYPVLQQPSINQFSDPNNTTVFIGGLSTLITEDELRTYFQPFGQIVYVKIPVGKGCGFVQYVDRVSAETAISKMQGFPIGNSRIRLSWGRSAKQAAAMQQAISLALKQQTQQNQQVQQQQQQQQIPQYSYQPQPSMPSNYSYNMDSLPGNHYVPVSHNNASYTSQPQQSLSQQPLLPSYTSMEYQNAGSLNGSMSGSSSFQFPMGSSASSLGSALATQQNGFNLNSNMNMQPNVSQSSLFASSLRPQLSPQSTDIYTQKQVEMIDFLEQGGNNNGYIFA
ncbi:hypothetical protein C6P41_003893 [Kluyveromyces marxianus]|nr:hypothetical protein C6P43_000615 [Kluyveromyces marxianus]KAG0685669.1 hypothetical protein C6P41_003893 [Kluyveromyces marxianus]